MNMSTTLTIEVKQPQTIGQKVTSEYKTILCRLENGCFWLYRSRPAHTADRIVKEYNVNVLPGRRYYAFPMHFNANVLGTNYFAPILLQAIEDHLQRPADEKYQRIMLDFISVATTQQGMTQDEVEAIVQEMTYVYQKTKGGQWYGTGD